MSLDLWMRSKICDTCGHQAMTESFNITYNIAPMWFLIYPDDKQMIDIDGMSGRESYGKLFDAFYILKEYPETFIPLNPKNGWGKYEDLVEYVNILMVAAEALPYSIWESSR
jgi:hypothetical protein